MILQWFFSFYWLTNRLLKIAHAYQNDILLINYLPKWMFLNERQIFENEKSLFFSVGIEENKTRILTYNSIYLPTYFKIFQLLTIMVFLHIQFFCLPWQYGGVKFGEMPLPVLTFILRASSKDQCNLLRSLSALWQKYLEALPSSSKSTSF